MAGNKPTVWKTASAVSSAPLVDAGESDGLKSARELHSLYLAKAKWVERFNPGAGKYYREAADAVAKLLGDVAANTLAVTFNVAIAGDDGGLGSALGAEGLIA